MSSSGIHRVVVVGVGYIGPGIYGMQLRGLHHSEPDLRGIYRYLLKESVLPERIRNFGRFDRISRQTCLAAGLALHDAAPAAQLTKANVGLLAVNRKGALETNMAYFRDYLDSGRKLGRGNFFIYTLPTSPLAETAICYRLRGPILYAAFTGDDFRQGVAMAEAMITEDGLPAMLLFMEHNGCMVCLLMMPSSADLQDRAMLSPAEAARALASVRPCFRFIDTSSGNDTSRGSADSRQAAV